MTCIDYNMCSGSKPFWVGWDNPRFPFARHGYLQPMCGCCPNYKEDKTCETEQRLDALETQRIADMPERRTAQMQAKINQLEGRLNEHISIAIEAAKVKKQKKDKLFK